jgi:hypothetical protein
VTSLIFPEFSHARKIHGILVDGGNDPDIDLSLSGLPHPFWLRYLCKE